MRESFLLRIDADPPARVWGGIGDLAIPSDSVEPGGATYSGAGELLQNPDFEQLINGVAERLDIQVSGVTAETLRLALEDAPSVRGARVDFGRVSFDDDWQIDTVEWEAVFRADVLSVDSKDGEQGRIRTITLSIASANTNRSNAPISYFTDADQKRRSSTDDIFSHVGGITAGASRRFGPQQ
ncbi:MAG: hypothetical protein GC201_00970 [Alphaproteobacteria bacterium]|nr:hypothetical protein [Alphaproteobacteria bacterium]